MNKSSNKPYSRSPILEEFKRNCRVFCVIPLNKEPQYESETADNERSENVGRTPGVRLISPTESNDEKSVVKQDIRYEF